MEAWLHDTSISLFQKLKMMIDCQIFLSLNKGKVKFQNKRGNSSENAKKFDEFQENTSNIGFLVNSALF